MSDIQLRPITLEDMSEPDIQTQLETLATLATLASACTIDTIPKNKPPKKSKINIPPKETPIPKYIWSSSGIPREPTKHPNKTRRLMPSLNIKTLVKDRVLEMNLPTKYEPYAFRECVSENLCGQFQCVVDKKPFQVCWLCLLYLLYLLHLI